MWRTLHSREAGTSHAEFRMSNHYKFGIHAYILPAPADQTQFVLLQDISMRRNHSDIKTITSALGSRQTTFKGINSAAIFFRHRSQMDRVRFCQGTVIGGA